MREYKILITGSVGAGKTTAISAISESTVVSTEALNSDPSVSKPLTTVGLDYGELCLDNGDRLRLFGTPGQQRFSFMWRTLAKGALGIVILVNHRASAPLDDLEDYVRAFWFALKRLPFVVGISHLDGADADSDAALARYSETMARLGRLCPIVPVDTRRQADVLQLLELLLVQVEGSSLEANYAT